MSFMKSWTLSRPAVLANHPTFNTVFNWIIVVYFILMLVAVVGFCMLVCWRSDETGDGRTAGSTGKRSRQSSRSGPQQKHSLGTSEETSLPEVPSSFARLLLPNVFTVNEKPGIGTCVGAKRTVSE